MITVRQRVAKAIPSDTGFSLIEIMIVMAVLGVVTSIAAVQIGLSRPGYIADGAMRVILSQMNQAREMAITQRRNMRLSFLGTGQVQITREEVPAALTVISAVDLEGGMQYGLVTGLPDSPDTFGNTTATSFQLAGVTATVVRFGTDGTLVNQDGLTLNGSVFVSLPNATQDRKLSARVVTVLGSTGRIRGYKWDGARWKPV
jgi:prepilin-type N-terminal cleavage/methylation domain-containing protein